MSYNFILYTYMFIKIMKTKVLLIDMVTVKSIGSGCQLPEFIFRCCYQVCELLTKFLKRSLPL